MSSGKSLRREWRMIREKRCEVEKPDYYSSYAGRVITPIS